MNPEKPLYEGIISTTPKGTGFLSVDTLPEDILIERENLDRALHGDQVEVSLIKTKKGERTQGKVVRVLERARKHFVGTVYKEKGDYYLKADTLKMYTPVRITSLGNLTVREGEKALVSFDNWNQGKPTPEGTLLKVLGTKGDHETEMQSIILDKGIVYDFPPAVSMEAERVAKEEITEEDTKVRRDFRKTTTFTIDPVDAKDFDDALSFRRLDNGNYEIGVHIADVSHYVRENSALDKEARSRMFTVYLVDRTIPMLPEILSNEVCSLNPHVDRRTFSGIFEITPEGNVVGRSFSKTLIYSDRRFSYEEAQESLDKGGDYHDELVILNSLAKTFRARRFKAGAIDFADTEVKFKLDEAGKPIDIIKKERLDTHMLVEEFMLLCNREVAEFVNRICKEHGYDRLLVYRVHDLPDRERLEELGIFLRALGYEFDPKDGPVDGKIINTLLEQARGKSEEGLINTSLIRSMAKAVYSTKNKGHFGLAFEHYAHFTSPIRRYPDLLVHRLLHKYLSSEKVSAKDISKYEKMSLDASAKEVQVLEAERESIKYKQVEYLREHIGEIFTGVITGVSEYGLFVEEQTTKAQGLVKIGTLGSDYFVLSKKHFAVIGEKTGVRFTLGDTVTFKLASADLDRKQLDFELVRDK